MFLTRAEVKELTGYVRPSKQAAWLARNGIRHWVAVTGYPMVPRSAIDDRKPSANDERPFELGHVG